MSTKIRIFFSIPLTITVLFFGILFSCQALNWVFPISEVSLFGKDGYSFGGLPSTENLSFTIILVSIFLFSYLSLVVINLVESQTNEDNKKDLKIGIILGLTFGILYGFADGLIPALIVGSFVALFFTALFSVKYGVGYGLGIALGVMIGSTQMGLILLITMWMSVMMFKINMPKKVK